MENAPLEIRNPGETIILDKYGSLFATIHCGSAEDVCKAYNSFDALVEALVDLSHLCKVMNDRQHAGMRNTPTQWAMLYELTNKAQAVVARAKGE